MKHHMDSETNMQPTLADLTSRFLSQPYYAESHEFEPYDVISAFRVEPRDAWFEALTVLKALGVTGPMPKMPAEWSGMVREQSPVQFVPMALGTYPQQVSELSKLLEAKFDSMKTDVPAKALVLLQKTADGNDLVSANESAVKLWSVGQTDTAIAAWKSMPDSAVKSFNLGMAYLAEGNRSSAIDQLKEAIVSLPKESGWQSLAELYLALAESELSTKTSNSAHS